MNNPQLSIIVPVYNVEAYIDECLDSIAEQTFKDWECILIDDGSRDWSGFICDNYHKKDSRFKVVHQNNAGVSAARNVGIELASAPLISFIDPDDYISKDYFKTLVAGLNSINGDVSVSFFSYVNQFGKESLYALENTLELISKRRFANSAMLSNSEVLKALCDNLFSCTSWGEVFRRDLWGDTRFPVGIDLGEDMMIVPPIIAKAKAAIYVPEAVYYYRQREISLLNGTVTRERYLKDIQASAKMVEDLIKYAPQYEKEFSRLKFQYDAGCYVNYVRSNGIKRNKSFLFDMLQMYDETDATDFFKALQFFSLDGGGQR